MHNNPLRALTLFCALIFLVSVGCVFADWRFSTDPPQSVEHTFSLDAGEFKWEGSDILPDDVQGEDHAWLIGNLINGTKNGKIIGLDNPDSDLNDYIQDRLKGGLGWERDYFGSMAVTGNTEMEALFGAAAQGLSFIIQVVNDNEYYIFTTSVYLGQRGEPNWLNTGNKTPGKPSVPIGEYIYAIYRTKITRASTSSNWNIVETKAGKALSDWYDENRRNANITQIPSFDPDSWVEASMGGSATTGDAIWTFVGDEATAYPTSRTTPVYYRITPASAGNRVVTSYNTDCTIKVYNNRGQLLATSSPATDGNGTAYVSVAWSASANTLYYLSLEGSMSMHFTVQ